MCEPKPSTDKAIRTAKDRREWDRIGKLGGK